MRRDRRLAAGRPRDRSVPKEPWTSRIVSITSVLTAVCALLLSVQTFRLTRKDQFTGRFSSAVELLGSDKDVTRVGAIFALGQLAIDSDRDRSSIVDLLTDYVKARVPVEMDRCRNAGAATRDVVAALRVLFFKITSVHRAGEVDLSRVCIIGVSFPGADLSCMRLDNSFIERSDLEDANFAGASLEGARLRNSRLVNARFIGAGAAGAIFGDETDVPSAYLEGADFRGADVGGARFFEVTLTGADFRGATLTGADFTGATLTDVEGLSGTAAPSPQHCAGKRPAADRRDPPSARWWQ